MITNLAELEGEIATLLADVANANFSNRLSTKDLREATAQFRREIDADQIAHGASLGDPDWNLVMADADVDELALFAITLFRPDSLTISAGRADRWDVVNVCNRFTLAEVDDFEVAITSVAQIRSVKVALPLARLWLGV